jgi:hypothetical protein
VKATTMLHAKLLAGLMLVSALAAQQDTPALLPVVAVPAGGKAPVASFVALAREGEGANSQATIWSIDPATRTAERRCVLGFSRYPAEPVLDSQRILLWQPMDHERWHLVRLDAARLTTEHLLSARYLRKIGRGGDKTYVCGNDGMCFVRETEGGPQPVQPSPWVLAQHGASWLVASPGDKLALFDAANGRVVRRFTKLEPLPSRGETRWDGGRFVVLLGYPCTEDRQPIKSSAQPKPAWRELQVIDLDTEAASTVLVRTQTRGGIYPGPPLLEAQHLELVGGMLRYSERKPVHGDSPELDSYDERRDLEWVTIDIATGKELLRDTYVPRPTPPAEPPPAERVPEYLRERYLKFQSLGHPHSVAGAFLEHAGVGIGDWRLHLNTVCRTADGMQILVLMYGKFHLCDLAEKKHTSWPAAEALTRWTVTLHELR